MEKPAAPTKSAKKPWPMTWIVLVIVVYIAGYTYINIAYRKPTDSAHHPAADAQERLKRAVQSNMGGWTRISAGFAEASPGDIAQRAEVAQKPLPAPLHRFLPVDLPPIIPYSDGPLLHPGPMSIVVPSTVPAADMMRVRLEFPEGASVPAFGEILVYAKDNHLYLFIQDHQRIAPDAMPIPAAPSFAVALPPAVLSAGAWKASLFNATTAFEWSFTVE